VTGISGIGKSAVVKETAHYLFNRDFTKDGIIYMSLTDCHSIENFFKRFSITVKNSLKASDTPFESKRQHELDRLFSE
jgi:excinuclease UvrABC ATPase subunit